MVLGSYPLLPPLSTLLTSPYQPEFAHPYEVLAPHVSAEVASPLGGTAPLDETSVEAYKEDAVSVKFLQKKLWENTQKLSSFLGRAKEYDAIFFVGGVGRVFAPLCAIEDMC
jgi:putative intracellular protease/amidase